MIVTSSELKELENYLEQVILFIESDDDEVENPQEPVFFANRPHLLMPLGFDEFRAVAVQMNEGRPKEADSVPLVPFASFDFPYELFYRTSSSGVWEWFDGITHYKKEEGKTIERKGKYYIHFVGHTDEHKFTLIDSWLKLLQRTEANPDLNPHFLVLPGIWTPHIQLNQKVELASTVPEILKAIYTYKTTLQEISWRTLQEIIAELLRSRGLEVFVNPRSYGSDHNIVARGELIPGEPTLLAIEIKQKPVVGLEDVQRALRANEDFPALMIATSGRFSAGVIQEKARHRNQLRLFIKDGIALAQWIEIYGLQHRWAQVYTNREQNRKVEKPPRFYSLPDYSKNIANKVSYGVDDVSELDTPTLSKITMKSSTTVSESPRALRVFLCHSSNDKPIVRELHKRLSTDQVDPWLDEENLLPGQDWSQEIMKAVRNADVVIVCLSQGSINKAGYIQKEIKYALDVADEQPEGTIFLIPLKLEECAIPERLRRWQWVNYYEDKGYKRLLDALRVRASTLAITLPP